MAGDVPEMGTRMIAVTDDAPEHGAALAERLGRELFANRGRHMMPMVDEREAVARAMAAATGPVVIADAWDNPGGGTAGDATVILRELMARGAAGAAVGTIWDPVAVQLCGVAGEGAVIPLRFGAKSAPFTGEPVDATVEVVRFVRGAEMRFGESVVPFGDAARVRLEGTGIEVILNTVRAQSYDPSLFAAVGIDPLAQRILVVKSTNHFHAAFAPIASEVIYCSAGRPYPNDPARTPYRKARRDIWPIVDDPFGDAAAGRAGT
jgi:microcystin degradation protein MlrC